MQYNQDKWVPVTTAWHVRRLWIEERPQIWKVAANIFNKQSQIADTGWYSAKGLDGVQKTTHCKNVSCYKI